MLPGLGKRILLPLVLFFLISPCITSANADATSELRSDLGYSAEEFIGQIKEQLKLRHYEGNLIKQNPVKHNNGLIDQIYTSQNKKITIRITENSKGKASVIKMTVVGTKKLMTTLNSVMPLFLSFFSSVDQTLTPENTQDVMRKLVFKMASTQPEKASTGQSFGIDYNQIAYSLTVEKQPNKAGVLALYASRGHSKSLAKNGATKSGSTNFSVAQLKVMQKAADEGNPAAQVMIAHAYFNGESGYPKDEKRGAQYIEKAARQNHPIAQYGYAMLYMIGQGVDEDYSKAASWFEKSASQGYSKAQFWLGKLYHKGLGVEKDSQKALVWIKKSAAQDDLEAKAWLSDNQ